MPRTLVICAVALALTWAGCGRNLRDAARLRHAAEVSCRYDLVYAVEIGRRMYAAEGCGYTAVYVCSRRGCTIDGVVREMP